MKKSVPMNQQCYAVGCEKRQAKGHFYCPKHLKAKNVKNKVPGVAAFDNTPAKI